MPPRTSSPTSGWASPEWNRELFELLAKAGWLPAELGARLQDMAGLRDVVVHEYAAVDLAIVRDVVDNRLGDLLEFAAAMRSKLR